MVNAKPILYGVSDFVRMRTEGACYIDRTAYIRELEKTSYVMFLRPRRFGKSLLSRFPGDKGRLVQARELLRFSEDQFVFWEKPYTPADEPKEFVEWNRPWAGKWDCPGVTEQYSCCRPIDASASKLIQTYLTLYKAERNPLDLAKAKTLGDRATRMQSADGFIPTFWSDHPHVVHDNWVNCVTYTAEALAQLAECE